MILICCSSDRRGPPNGGDPIDPTRLDVDSWPVATPASGRQLFLDGLRGLALIFMVLNHTGRWWIERPLGWPHHEDQGQPPEAVEEELSSRCQIGRAHV